MRFPELPEDIVKHVTELRGLDLSWRDPNNPNLHPTPEGDTYFIAAGGSGVERNVLVDADDFIHLSKRGWNIHRRGRSDKFDAYGKVGGAHCAMSRVIMSVTDYHSFHVHHANHEPLDNRKRNLVVCATWQAHVRLHRLMGSPSDEMSETLLATSALQEQDVCR